MSRNKLVLLSAIVTVSLVFLVVLIGIFSVIIYYNEMLRPDINAFNQAATLPIVGFGIILVIGLCTIVTMVNNYQSLSPKDTVKIVLNEKMHIFGD